MSNALEEIDDLFMKIKEVQGEWDGSCNRKECYWNLWHPKFEITNNEESYHCTSESLSDTKMIPNSKDCPSYWNYEVACGCKKGK